MPEFDLRNIVDIALVALGLWTIITWLRRARAGMAALGAIALAAIYLAAREFRLELTAWMLQGFFAVFLLVAVVVFQNDLRRTFERMARWGLRKEKRRPFQPEGIYALSGSLFELANRKWGALIVIPGIDHVEHHVEGGHLLSGELSHALLMSLFDPNSPGHDGAVILENGRVSRFGVHLPLSTNFRELRDRGTRHSAALGLSEVTDAMCIVASEERGEVQIAAHGRLTSVETVPALEQAVQDHLNRVSPATAPFLGFKTIVRRYAPEVAVALALSLSLWSVFVSGPELSERTFRVPVQIENIPLSYEVDTVDPEDVEVVLRGEARELFLVDPTELRVRVDGSRLQPAREQRQITETFRLSERNVLYPEALTFGTVSPPSVTLRLRRTDEETIRRVPASGRRGTRPSDIRWSTVSRSTLAKNASMYFPRSDGL